MYVSITKVIAVKKRDGTERPKASSVAEKKWTSAIKTLTINKFRIVCICLLLLIVTADELEIELNTESQL